MPKGGVVLKPDSASPPPSPRPSGTAGPGHPDSPDAPASAPSGAPSGGIERVAPENVTVLLTAAEAYPHLEGLFLGARQQITAGFRVFDPETRLHSDAARALGDTWFDLIVAVLKHGVHIRITLADFDPVNRPDMHHRAHRCLRQLIEAGKASGAPERLDARARTHPARSSALHRLVFYPAVRRKLAGHARSLDKLPLGECRAWLGDAPLLADLLTRPEATGRLAPRAGHLPPLIPGSHHQKLAVFDRTRLYVGGLDLNDRRFDGPDHDRQSDQTWHDVQLSLTGPIAAAAEDHLLAFEAETAGEHAPVARPGLLRTLSRAAPPGLPRIGPQPLVREIRARFLDEIARAERLIYLETQFLRDLAIARALCQRARACPTLHLIVILPAAPDDVLFENNTGLDARFGEYLQARCVAMIQTSFGARAAIIAPAKPESAHGDPCDFDLGGAPLVYVHAKAATFDNACALIGSANLNGRSLNWDTEVAVAMTHPETVAAIRTRLMQHWLADNPDPASTDIDSAAPIWQRLAAQNAEIAPGDRTGFLMPFPFERARQFGRWVPGIPHEMV